MRSRYARQRRPRLYGALLVYSTVALAACSQGEVADIPTGLEGTYSMELSAEIVREPDPDLPEVFEGTWELELENGSYLLTRGTIRIPGDLRASDETVRFLNPPAPEGPFNCSGGADGVYDYVVDDASVRFSVVEEPCPTRAILIQREWTRSS